MPFYIKYDSVILKERAYNFIKDIEPQNYKYFFEGVIFGMWNLTLGYQQYDYIDIFLSRFNRANEIDEDHSQEYCQKFWKNDTTEYEFKAWERGILASSCFEFK